MARRQVSRKRRVRKNIENGVTYVRSTFNSTIMTITDEFDNALSWSSADALGFEGSRKSTPFAAQMTSETTSKSVVGHGSKTVEVAVKGPGSGREPTIRALQSAGLEVVAVRDVTSAPHNSCHPPKRRRV